MNQVRTDSHVSGRLTLTGVDQYPGRGPSPLGIEIFASLLVLGLKPNIFFMMSSGGMLGAVTNIVLCESAASA
jgi:hypothetical protein